MREAEEIYPADPRPSTVEVILDNAIPPGPKAVEKEEIACPTELKEEIKEEVNDAVEI